MHGADLIVIGIEQITEIRVKRLVTGHMRREDKGFEEPACVSEVPFHRRSRLHGLQHAVLGAQWPGERFAYAPDAQESIEYSFCGAAGMAAKGHNDKEFF